MINNFVKLPLIRKIPVNPRVAFIASISCNTVSLDVQWSTFDKQLAAGFRRHLTLEELSGEVKSKFMLWDGSRIITSCLVGLVSPGGHQNWAKLSTLNRMQRTQLFPL
ncbi:hypothetical protein T4E_946 [Trichinella pseudospiralis]|uniref:Uncharacterized protein n=1 Tax=Trichinella pseudospiralis TaxID=6337 RepID=A0A0V0XPX1_TRIPS|nr:hypothetical protein T4E_11885 [Trichinella pseudospiralis]KRX89965.1 hypothetical protein T4E_4186 [Trichinella pseudospiralis]KRX89966.1 hypothetical protein T4E_946 [Trichinella pseudospiralis]